jgi:hypothetical protein
MSHHNVVVVEQSRCRREPSPFKWRNNESPQRSSGSTQLVKKTLAEDALRSVPIFEGGYSEYVGWRMTATKFLKAGFYSQETAFQLLKKTLEGEAKKIVDLISVEDDYACEDLMQSLEEEYGDVSFLAAEQKRKLTAMKPISYGARNLLNFCRTVNKIARILWEAGEDVNTPEFVSLVLSRLPTAYRSRLTDALRLKKHWGLDATMEELQEIARTERANKKMLEAYSWKEQKKDEKKKDEQKEKKDNWKKKEKRKDSSVNAFSTTTAAAPRTTPQPTSNQQQKKKDCPGCHSQHDLADCSTFVSLTADDRLQRAKDAYVCFRCLKKHPRGKCQLWAECEVHGNNCRYAHHKLLHGTVAKRMEKKKRNCHYDDRRDVKLRCHRHGWRSRRTVITSG